MPNDLFKQAAETPEGSAFNDGRPTLEDKNYLEELVGEGKKFKTVEDLARGKAESDLFISSLLREKKEVVEELNKRLTVEDLLDKLEKRNPQGNGSQTNSMFNTSEQNNNSGTQSQDGNQLDLEKIKEAIKKDMEAEQARQRAASNIAMVQEELVKMFGDNASQVLRSKAQELGVSLDRLSEIAAEAPKVFLASLGTPIQPTKESLFTPPTSQINSVNNGQKSYGEYKPMSYWQKLKETDRKKYFDPKTAVEMHKHALKLGDSFFDI